MGQHFRMSLASLILDPYVRLASDQYLSRHGERSGQACATNYFAWGIQEGVRLQ